MSDDFLTVSLGKETIGGIFGLPCIIRLGVFEVSSLIARHSEGRLQWARRWHKYG